MPLKTDSACVKVSPCIYTILQWALSEGSNNGNGGKLAGKEVKAYKQVIPGIGSIRA